jgi:hypothetical protein
MASKLEIQERRGRIQRLESQGVRSPAEIGRRLGMPLRTVQADIAALDLAFKAQEAAAQFRLTMKRQQVAAAECRYGELEAEWQRSKKDKEKLGGKKVDVGGDGNGAGQRTEAHAEKEGRLADVGYMREMRENDKHVADLLGLIVDKHEHTGPDGERLHGWDHSLTLEIFAAVAAHDDAKAAAEGAGRQTPGTPETPP